MPTCPICGASMRYSGHQCGESYTLLLFADKPNAPFLPQEALARKQVFPDANPLNGVRDSIEEAVAAYQQRMVEYADFTYVCVVDNADAGVPLAPASLDWYEVTMRMEPVYEARKVARKKQ